MKTFKSKNINKQAGVSLPEMLIVTIIIGLLGMLSYSQFGNGSSGVRAKTTFDAAQKIASTWSMIAQMTGVPVTTATSALLTTPATVTALDAVMVGDSVASLIATKYASAYSMVSY